MSKRKAGGIYARAVILDVCRDGTLSYRQQGEPRLNQNLGPDNTGALPVFSVDTVEQAENFQVTFCRKQYREHPNQPGRPWYRLSRLNDGTDPACSRPDGLQFDDLHGLGEMFQAHWDKYHVTKGLTG